MIVARLEGGPLEKTGVIAGMSGSPVYIDGKLIGAVAYGFPFSKETIGGITPICGHDRRHQDGRTARGLRALPHSLRRVRTQGAAGPRRDGGRAQAADAHDPPDLGHDAG